MLSDFQVDIRSNVRTVMEQIARSAEGVGRRGESVKLVAVSKTVEAPLVRQALEAGVSCLGENRVQEGEAKRSQLADRPFEFHLIGPLQKNKVNKAVACFDWIETVDSLELARKIDQACASLLKTMPVLIQVNVGQEPTKSGAKEEDLASLARGVEELNHLSLMGLMAIPPFQDDPEQSRPYFRRLRGLLDTVNSQRAGKAALAELSMGMSHDFSVAIEEGATLVRVGTAIFGERRYR